MFVRACNTVRVPLYDDCIYSGAALLPTMLPFWKLTSPPNAVSGTCPITSATSAHTRLSYQPAAAHKSKFKVNCHRVPKLSPYGEKRMHALKGLAYRKRVAAASSPAATCKQGAALTSPARHACGCARPSRARFGQRSRKLLSDGVKHIGTLRYTNLLSLQ
jgi:hypothetical protein